ncbi:MAG TPA: SDR family NAD(P)-dependent oxidoreductase [Thermoanaerobaculia bacterium]|jgi:NAD(P)-dependent dehydrogenase (short-subunit alcohol dehydrogenase family)|nr:SDR family NAD(P)-dependent oxidoreductase [Thermoanaerobaculia bacterium]
MTETRRVAVVSGGGSGLGREIALELARRGYDLALLGRRRQPLEETLALAGVRESGVVFPCDVRDAEAVERCAGEINARWGAADVVVPAAGTSSLAPVEGIAPEDFNDILTTNLTGVFLLLRALLPAMKERGRGWIFPLLSVAARRAFPGWGAYCASKWGLRGLIEVLREELKGTGVRVTALFPGATDTPIWDRLPGTWDRTAMVRPQEVARALAYALEADPSTLVEEIHLGPAGGAL